MKKKHLSFKKWLYFRQDYIPLHTKKDLKNILFSIQNFLILIILHSKPETNPIPQEDFFITKWQKVLLICHDFFWGLYCKENRLQLPASFQELYIEMLLSLANKPKSSKKSKYQYFSIFSPYFKRIFAFSTNT